MMIFQIEGLPDDAGWTVLRRKLAEADSPHCRLADDTSASVTVALSGVPPADARPEAAGQWALVWGDGKPLTALVGLKEAVCAPYAVVELHLLEYKDSAWVTLRHAALAVAPGNFAASFARVLDRAARLIIQAATDRHNGVHRARPSFVMPLAVSMARQDNAPAWWRVRAALCRLRALTGTILLDENWMIGLVDAPIAAALQWTHCPPVRWIGARSLRRYLADPFAMPGNEQIILCEEYDFADRMGRIRQLTLDGTVITQEAPVGFNLPGHVSFPFLFAHEGEIYCMPESSAARRLTIFRRCGGAWQEVATPLQDAAAADGVLFKYGEYFWIAYTDTGIDRFDNLNLCYAPALDGPWRPHANNPVRLDPRNARCGGTPFWVDGELYRPVQDCARTYGGAIRIMHITECTPDAYAEAESAFIQPSPGMNPHGLHTLSVCGGRCLVDGKRMIFSWRRIALKTRQRLRRMLAGYRQSRHAKPDEKLNDYSK